MSPMTLYDILQISTTATVTEVQAAYETQYNHWRRLVTHHDPDIVNKANQALQWLERARETLTDPARRAAYDANIGLRGPVGGLTDPQAKVQDSRPTPPPPRPRPVPQARPASAASERVDVWLCPQCQTVNDIGARFCKKCGHQIGTECVKCGESMEVGAEFCPACGANQEQARQEKELEEAEEARKELELARKYAEEEQTIQETKRLEVLFYPLFAISLEVSSFLRSIFKLNQLATFFLLIGTFVLTFVLFYRAVKTNTISFRAILTLLWAVAIFGGVALMLFLLSMWRK